MAVPAPEAARLLAQSPIAAWLGRVRVTPTCTLALVLDQPSSADYFGLSLPRGEDAGLVVAVCVQERKVGGLVPEGRGALVVLPAPDQAPTLAKLSLLPGLRHALEYISRGSLPSRVVFAGDYLVAPTVEGAVLSGLAAAAVLLSSFRSE